MASEYVVHPNGAFVTIKRAKDLDPSRVGAELQRHATNEAALEAAKSTRNPLHRHLEWDDAICGHHHRLGQIAALRSCIRIWNEETDETSRAFVGIILPGNGRQARYYSTPQVIDSAALQYALMKRWIAKLESMKSDFREIRDICTKVTDLYDDIKLRMEELRPPS